jgi:hypothetical protein
LRQHRRGRPVLVRRTQIAPLISGHFCCAQMRRSGRPR